MADVQIALALAADNGAGLPVISAMVGTPQVFTLSGTSQPTTTLTVPATHKGQADSGLLFWLIFPYGSIACFAIDGSAPVASSTAALPCPLGWVTAIKAKAVGDKCAVIWTS